MSSNLAGLNKISEGTVVFEEREKSAYAEHLQNLLSNNNNHDQHHDKHASSLAKYLPLKASNLIENMRDGVLIGHLLESLIPGSVPWSKMDLTVDLADANSKKVIFEVTNNLNCVIEAAKKNKQLVVVNIGANDLLEGKKDLVLGLLWQIVRAHLLASVNLQSHPELIRLLKPGESLQSLLSLKSETILLRWFNYHLQRSGYELETPEDQDNSSGSTSSGK